MEISRSSVNSMRLATRDGKDNDLRMMDSGGKETVARGLGALQYATTVRLDDTSHVNGDITI